MTHKHHLIPRYRGGSNSKDNLVEVSVTCHAMFHYCNWILWGQKEDWLAWKGLVGEIGKEEIMHQVRLKASKKGSLAIKEKYKFLRENNPEYISGMRDKVKKIQPFAVEAAKSESAKEKRLETFKRIEHQKGEKNSMYGTMWITNGTKGGSFRINKNDPIPEGYRKGRVCS